MANYFSSHKGESSRVANAKRELENLENAPLTEKYKPANVDIIGTLTKSSSDSKSINSAGLTSKTVLYYNSSNSRLALMTNVNGNYVAEKRLYLGPKRHDQ
jgi:hypothetical protein